MRKILAASLAVVFTFTNITFAHRPAVAEAMAGRPAVSVWEERQPNNTQLTPAIKTFSPVQFRPRSGKRASPLVAGLPALLFSHLNIKEVHSNAGRPTVLLIEDLHQNLEAQTHISEAIHSFGSLSGNEKMLVALEGAAGGFVYDEFRKYPDAKIVREVADTFLHTNQISGPAHAGFTYRPEPNKKDLFFWGVENPALYCRNVEAYRNSREIQSATETRLKEMVSEVNEQKIRNLNVALRGFDSMVESHRAGSLPMGDYAQVLAHTGVSTSFTVETFLQAYAMEKSLDFARVDAERARVLEKLVKKISEDELNNLMNMSLGYQQGVVTFSDYYAHLRSLCQKAGVELAQTPAFDNYIRYALLSDGVEASKLFADLAAMEQAAYDQLATTISEKTLIARSHQLYLAGELVKFALTSEQWAQYQKGRSLLSASLDLSTFEDFYIAADLRNEAMVTNLQQATTGDSVLVAGGFHTLGLTDLLKKNNLSYVVATPKITKLDVAAETHYLSVFDREKTLLEQLFSGKKLFLTSPVAGLENKILEGFPDPVPQMKQDIENRKKGPPSLPVIALIGGALLALAASTPADSFGGIFVFALLGMAVSSDPSWTMTLTIPWTKTKSFREKIWPFIAQHGFTDPVDVPLTDPGFKLEGMKAFLEEMSKRGFTRLKDLDNKVTESELLSISGFSVSDLDTLKFEMKIRDLGLIKEDLTNPSASVITLINAMDPKPSSAGTIKTALWKAGYRTVEKITKASASQLIEAGKVTSNTIQSIIGPLFINALRDHLEKLGYPRPDLRNPKTELLELLLSIDEGPSAIMRVNNSLAMVKVVNILDLVKFGQEKLRKVRGVGAKRAIKIWEKLTELGYGKDGERVYLPSELENPDTVVSRVIMAAGFSGEQAIRIGMSLGKAGIGTIKDLQDQEGKLFQLEHIGPHAKRLLSAIGVFGVGAVLALMVSTPVDFVGGVFVFALVGVMVAGPRDNPNITTIQPAFNQDLLKQLRKSGVKDNQLKADILSATNHMLYDFSLGYVVDHGVIFEGYTNEVEGGFVFEFRLGIAPVKIKLILKNHESNLYWNIVCETPTTVGKKYFKELIRVMAHWRYIDPLNGDSGSSSVIPSDKYEGYEFVYDAVGIKPDTGKKKPGQRPALTRLELLLILALASFVTWHYALPVVNYWAGMEPELRGIISGIVIGAVALIALYWGFVRFLLEIREVYKEPSSNTASPPGSDEFGGFAEDYSWDNSANDPPLGLAESDLEPAHEPKLDELEVVKDVPHGTFTLNLLTRFEKDHSSDAVDMALRGIAWHFGYRPADLNADAGLPNDVITAYKSHAQFLLKDPEWRRSVALTAKVVYSHATRELFITFENVAEKQPEFAEIVLSAKDPGITMEVKVHSEYWKGLFLNAIFKELNSLRVISLTKSFVSENRIPLADMFNENKGHLIRSNQPAPIVAHPYESISLKISKGFLRKKVGENPVYSVIDGLRLFASDTYVFGHSSMRIRLQPQKIPVNSVWNRFTLTLVSPHDESFLADFNITESNHVLTIDGYRENKQPLIGAVASILMKVGIVDDQDAEFDGKTIKISQFVEAEKAKYFNKPHQRGGFGLIDLAVALIIGTAFFFAAYEWWLLPLLVGAILPKKTTLESAPVASSHPRVQAIMTAVHIVQVLRANDILANIDNEPTPILGVIGSNSMYEQWLAMRKRQQAQTIYDNRNLNPKEAVRVLKMYGVLGKVFLLKGRRDKTSSSDTKKLFTTGFRQLVQELAKAEKKTKKAMKRQAAINNGAVVIIGALAVIGVAAVTQQPLWLAGIPLAWVLGRFIVGAVRMGKKSARWGKEHFSSPDILVFSTPAEVHDPFVQKIMKAVPMERIFGDANTKRFDNEGNALDAFIPQLDENAPEVIHYMVTAGRFEQSLADLENIMDHEYLSQPELVISSVKLSDTQRAALQRAIPHSMLSRIVDVPDDTVSVDRVMEAAATLTGSRPLPRVQALVRDTRNKTSSNIRLLTITNGVPFTASEAYQEFMRVVLMNINHTWVIVPVETAIAAFKEGATKA